MSNAPEDCAKRPCRTGPVRRGVRRTLRLLERGFALLGVGFVVFVSCFDASRMTSESMSPTLQGTDCEHADRILTERVSYWFRAPRRWEVITFRHRDGTQVMKRVVGLPGETVQMLDGGRILINGQECVHPGHLQSLHYFPFGNLTAERKFPCENGYYVLGDYSRDSDDSRFEGTIKPHQIVGRAWLIYAPRSRFGAVR